MRNTGPVAGTEVVQLYLGDPVATVVRPVQWLAGFARAALEPGEAARVTFRGARGPDRVHRAGLDEDRRARHHHSGPRRLF